MRAHQAKSNASPASGIRRPLSVTRQPHPRDGPGTESTPRPIATWRSEPSSPAIARSGDTSGKWTLSVTRGARNRKLLAGAASCDMTSSGTTRSTMSVLPRASTSARNRVEEGVGSVVAVPRSHVADRAGHAPDQDDDQYPVTEDAGRRVDERDLAGS